MVSKTLASGSVRVGKQILDIVTSGMYSNPMMALREYVQNAVDSIDSARIAGVLSSNEGMIEVAVDPLERSISVTDNGAGLFRGQAQGVLTSLGASPKEYSGGRGFRGIGRLGGLAYCENLTFRTRARGERFVSVVQWDSAKLRCILSTPGMAEDVRQAIKGCVTASEEEPGPADSEHFFSVEMGSVRKFHNDRMMAEDEIRRYLTVAAPLDFDLEMFSYGKELHKFLSEVEGYACYDVKLNGEKLLKPYTDVIKGKKGAEDRIVGTEQFELAGVDGETVIGKGWYAKTSCLAGLPPKQLMRGVRVRQGNLEVGDEHFLADCFSERRFSTWHIGEIHLSPSVKTNARRDGFEQTDEYEAFLEQATQMGQFLSSMCRLSSKDRSQSQSVRREIDRIGTMIAPPFFVSEEEREAVMTEAGEALETIADKLPSPGQDRSVAVRFGKLRRALEDGTSHVPVLSDMLDGRSLGHEPRDIVCDLAAEIKAAYGECRSAEEFLWHVLDHYFKPSYRGE